MSISTQPFELRYPDEPGRLIRGRLELPEPCAEARPAPFVLIAHGFKGFMNWGFFPELSRRIAEAGLCAVSFNFSGSGVGPDLETIDDEEGFARDTFSRQVEDLGHVHAWATSGENPAIDPTRFGLFGHSRGGGVALLFAAGRRDLGALALWAAIDEVDRISDQDKQLMRSQGYLLFPNARTGQMHRMDRVALDDVEQNRQRLDILAASTRLQAPTLIVQGAEDPIVEVDAARRIHAAMSTADRELWIVPGLGHTMGSKHPLTEIPEPLAEVLSRTVRHLEGNLSI